ncbi:disulfide bond formation protein B [Variovorax paradoxus]|uniref:disulfide bond formation protein B n=1 Tax=Variovorax paradoxus TaxID=34073 RepID=UPI0009ECB6D4
MAFLVAFASTLGSLFFSEVMKLEPCVLCWYQRIAMFPLSSRLTRALSCSSPKSFNGFPLTKNPGVRVTFRILASAMSCSMLARTSAEPASSRAFLRFRPVPSTMVQIRSGRGRGQRPRFAGRSARRGSPARKGLLAGPPRAL